MSDSCHWVIESQEAVKSAGPGGGVDESGGGEISCGVQEGQAGRREGRRRKFSWCIGASSASAILYCRVGAGFCRARVALYERGKTPLPGDTQGSTFGPVGDDNGPGSEPPPHDRLRYVSTFMSNRRRPPAAVGKLSITYFPVDYLLHDVCRPDEPTDFPDLSGIQGIGPSASRRRRWISSISSWLGTNFGRESDHSTYVVARSGSAIAALVLSQ
ncbi:hypothetical protein THAOC_24513 [Thalassiosira oceanica]|uniref:Uncharacterized protein n=1 Tax=Thalassiosira oceanica TaxID=159749 RepID=K0RTP8_THAOC|nr:hypothetical protein THAOC_24513 [Thalassiosira oceanica]|eukprot:EJK55724.1 hypothetical protein THAOC_24513 [Thalassiosira oceanica]